MKLEHIIAIWLTRANHLSAEADKARRNGNHLTEADLRSRADELRLCAADLEQAAGLKGGAHVAA